MNALALCSGLGEIRLRVVELSSTDEFKEFSSLTPSQLTICPMLLTLKEQNPLHSLARSASIPGLVKGASYGSGMLVFTPDLKHYAEVCSSRVAGNRIKFLHGSEEVKFDRSECWEYVLKRQSVEVTIRQTRENPQTLPFELLRPDDTRCPICLDDLSGNVLHCPNNHQVCLPCFRLLPRVANVCKCPICRSYYHGDIYERVKLMEGIIKQEPGILTFHQVAGNSSITYAHNEALFLGLLRNSVNLHYMEVDEKILISAFFNWYVSHPERFLTYNFNMTAYSTHGQRELKDISHSDAILTFIEEIHHPDIYKDVANTCHWLNNYTEAQFNTDLDEIEGANAWNRNKEYPGNKKEFLKREIYFRSYINKNDRDALIAKFQNIINRIIIHSTNTNQNILVRRIIEVPLQQI